VVILVHDLRQKKGLAGGIQVPMEVPDGNDARRGIIMGRLRSCHGEGAGADRKEQGAESKEAGGCRNAGDTHGVGPSISRSFARVPRDKGR
jgi:hypothetical protein